MEKGDNQFVTLVVENHGHTAVRLRKGMRLGTVTTVDLVPAEEDEEGSRPDVVHRVEVTPLPSDERLDQLSARLKMDHVEVSPSEQKQLRSLIRAYSDVFTLDSSELGRTELVTHTIDTGDHHPARRTPFVLRTKVYQLVKEMLDQQSLG